MTAILQVKLNSNEDFLDVVIGTFSDHRILGFSADRAVRRR